MTIQQAINRVKSLRKLPDVAVEIMRDEVPHPGHSKGWSKGALRASIHKIEVAPYEWTIAVTAPHAKYVRWGRRALQMPRDALHDGVYPLRSKDGTFVSYHAAGVEANNFIGRTAARIRKIIYSQGYTVGTYPSYGWGEYDDYDE